MTIEKLLPYFIDEEMDIRRSKDPKKAHAFWIKAIWEVQTCDESNQLFTEMLRCPVCMVMATKDDEGVFVQHKPKRLIVN